MTGGDLRADFAQFPSGPLLIALSGGADSATLAHLAMTSGREVRAVFVDHGFAESASMRSAAVAIADALSMRLDIAEVVVGSGPSPENQARSARYDAIESMASDDELIATGHTADDNVETILFNILRGTGSSGLAGIPRRRARWIRPLLDDRRIDVRVHAMRNQLPFHDDPTNASLEPTRNRIRLELLPRLRDEFNPQVDNALLRLAAAAGEDEAALEPDVEPFVCGGVVRLPIGLLAAWPDAVATRALRSALRLVSPPYAGSAADVTAVRSVTAGATDRVTIAGAVEVLREGPYLVLANSHTAEPPPAVDLAVPGTTTWGAFTVEAVATDTPPIATPFGGWRRCVDAEFLGEKARIRAAAPGDVIAIAGGHKSVADALAEASIPPRERSNWPVVESDGKIVWLVGARLAAQATRNGSSARQVMLSVRRECE